VAIYKADHVEFAKLMHAPKIREALHDVAVDLRDEMVSHAPVGDEPKVKRYINSFHIDMGLDVRKKDRVAAFIYNDVPYASLLETGSNTNWFPPMPMTKALASMRKVR
jgi:Bacteriophage HK97-gp10, putative tail-component